MRFADRLFRAACACLLALTVLGGAQAPVHAETVSNIASARWSVGEQDFTVDSNEVAFEVVARPGRLTTFVVQPGGRDTTLLRHDYCTRGASGLTAQSNGPLAAVPLQPSGDILIGQKLVIRLDSPAANRDPGVLDSLTIGFSTESGDREEVTAIETSADSGTFFAAIVTTPQPPSPVAHDCQLSLRRDEVISIASPDPGHQASQLTAQMHALADPFGIVFSSRDGSPVDGARVTIVDDATGRPAQVFSFDGITRYPSTVITGETVIDSGGTDHRLGPGEYRFPLLAFGRYRLVVEPPAPFTAPSSASRADLMQLTRPDGQTFEISDASYGRPFEVVGVVPLRADIPLAAPGGFVSLSKRVSRDEAAPGDARLRHLSLRHL